MTKVSYKDWHCSLSNGEMTLEEVRKTLPANNPEDISIIVKLFENPKSPIALKGAVNLERHDCIHIVLGRGLLPQDEAFVIGFTMGTSKNITKLEEFFFKFVSMYLYPKKYKFARRHMLSYNLGLDYGKKCNVTKIYEFPFEDNLTSRLSDLRNELGLDTKELKKIYRRERELLPNTKVSQRLDV